MDRWRELTGYSDLQGCQVIEKTQMLKHIAGFHMTEREVHFHMRLTAARFNHGT